MVVPRDHHDALVTLVAVEKLGAVVEERVGRHAVVLEDDRFVDEVECPGYARRNPKAAAHVVFREIPLDFAVPVDSIDDGARRSALVGFSRPIRPGAVGDYEKLPRLRGPDRLENLSS